MSKKIVLFIPIFILCLISVFAVPTIKPYINDFADLLTTEQISSLNVYAQQIEKNTTVEIAIVTVQSTEGQDRILYATAIGDTNGVGQKATDNGIVVLWSLDNEKGGAIAVGRGIESTLNDAKVARIGRAARPLFDEGKTYDAFKQILDDIYNEVKPEEQINIDTTNSGNTEIEFFVIILIIILGTITSIILANNESEEEKPPRVLSKGFKKKYHIIKKGDKYYRRNKDGDYDLISTVMLLYLLNNWDNHSDNSRSDNYVSSSSSSDDDDSSSSSSSSTGSWGGGSFGGGGGRF